MSERSRKFSISVHFRREATIPALILGAIIAVAGLMALLGPWFFEHLA